jgi:hypothetical protein
VLARNAIGSGWVQHAAARGSFLAAPGSGADRISTLPDDVLLQVLARLGCARAAAHTSLLSRRWRGLWAFLPELTFHNMGPEPLRSALAQVARPAGSLIIRFPDHHRLSSAGITELLRAIASLALVVLDADIWEDVCARGDADAIELPRFERTTSITLLFRPMVPATAMVAAVGA